MHRCFFPNYKYTGKDKPKIAAARAAKEGLTMLPVDKYLEILSRRKKVKGAALGNKIDEQLRLFVNNTEKFKALEGRVDSTTKDFITAYGYWGWDMSKSQWPVAVPEYRIGTRLDMFGVDRNGRPVLIENKVGFSDYMYRPNGMMKGCLNFYNNCPLHQHRLQVLLESMLVKIMYGVDFGDNCFVVQATPRGIQRYRVPPELTRIKDKIWQQFATYLLESDVREQEKKEQKAEEKKQKREKRKRPKLAVIDVDDQTAVPELPRRKKRRVDTKDAIAV